LSFSFLSESRKVNPRGVERHGTFRADDVDGGGEFLLNVLGDACRRAIPHHGEVARAPHQRELLARQGSGQDGRHFGVEVETFESSLAEVNQAVGRVAADMENDRAVNTLVEFVMEFLKEIAVSCWRAQVAGAMVRQRERIGAGLDLGVGKGHCHFDELAHGSSDRVRFEPRGH
jgi:hypothetical protein